MKNNAYRLPDAYKKDKDSNNYRLLELNRQAAEVTEKDLEDIDTSLDIYQAYGKTLDLYGEMLGQKRGDLTDSQYIYALLAQIGKLLSTGDTNTIIRLMALLLKVDTAQIVIVDEYPAKIQILSMPFEQVVQAGFSMGQAVLLASGLLPAGVSIKGMEFETDSDFTVYFCGASALQVQYAIDSWGEKESDDAWQGYFGGVAYSEKSYTVETWGHTETTIEHSPVFGAVAYTNIEYNLEVV